MLKYLGESQLKTVINIDKFRSLGRELNLEEEIAAKLLQFDWTYRESDDGSVHRSGRNRQAELIELIKNSELSDTVKTKFLDLFSSSYEVQANVLEEYRWISMSIFKDSNPNYGMLDLYYRGVTDEDYASYIELTKLFNRLGGMVQQAGALDRLLMTDDHIGYQLIREKAATAWKEHKDTYWYGVTLPQSAQDLLDSIVREHKQTFINMVKDKAYTVLFGSFSVDTNNPDGVWHVAMQTNFRYGENFGFFFNPKPTSPRREYQSKPTPHTSKGNQTDTASTKSVKITPTARTKPAIPASIKPMVVENKPRPKTQKGAPKKRKQFAVLAVIKA